VGPVTGAALIVQGDALHLPLPDASVDLIVTSPPYWALRSYGITCRMCQDVIASGGDPKTAYAPSWDDHVARFHQEIGSEPTPQAYLEALWAATAEMMRVLKPTGSAFIDLGDKYAAHPTGHRPDETLHTRGGRVTDYQRGMGRYQAGIAQQKSLLLLPERYRVGCVDRLGLIARAVIVWNKPNGLPESVTDRVRRSHEDWVHLVKQPRYYSATDEIREPHLGRHGGGRNLAVAITGVVSGGKAHTGLDDSDPHPLGKLPGSVWSIPSEPLHLPDHLGVQHYAAFPSEWPRRLILAFSPPGICLECGQGRVPVVEREKYLHRPSGAKNLANPHGPEKVYGNNMGNIRTEATILGYACACTPFTDHPGTGEPSGPDKRYGDHLAAGNGYPSMTGQPTTNVGGGPHLSDRPKVGPWREYHLDRWTPPPTRPAVILDPFSGTGTTPMVARALGRIGIGIDLSHDYCRAARWRVHHDGAKAISRTWSERQQVLPLIPGNPFKEWQQALDLTPGPTLAELDRQRAELETWRERHDGINALGGWGGE
jgi:DNA modification methylase